MQQAGWLRLHGAMKEGRVKEERKEREKKGLAERNRKKCLRGRESDRESGF